MLVNQGRRRLGWKVFGGVAGVILAAVLGLLLWVHLVASRKMAEMEGTLALLNAEWGQRPLNRTSREGGPLPGNALKDYDLAVAAMPRLYADFQALEEFVNRTPKAERAAAKKVADAHPAVLDHLAKGVRRRDYLYQPEWTGGIRVGAFEPIRAIQIGLVVRAVARLRAEEGKPREAVDLLLDGCALGCDLGHNSVQIILESSAVSLIGGSLTDLRDLVDAGSLTRDDLLAVERSLGAIDDSFPRSGHAFVNDVLTFGYECLRPDGHVPTAANARYLWSDRLVMADAFNVLLEQARRVAELDSLPWHEAEVLSGKVEAEGYGTNPLFTEAVPTRYSRIHAHNRRTLAWLRLLRTGARWKATGEVPVLKDPFGGMLNHQVSGGRLKVWSAGPDGVDDGGSGDWGSYGKDIVLEVGR